MTPARRIAFSILRAVASGGFASDLLEQRLHGVDSRDAGLVTEIVLGVLRRRAQLDWLIEGATRRRIEELDESIRLILEMGAYQLRFLSRVPAHAAVSESVELARSASHARAAGLVNAALRQLPRKPKEWPNVGIALSTPDWILARWKERYGAVDAYNIGLAFLRTPQRWVRVPGGQPVAEHFRPTQLPGCYLVPEGDPAGFRQQDIGSQSIVPLLRLEPGHRFLDLCAAPGMKTLQALETPVQAVACDASGKRLRALLADCPRVHLDGAGPLPFGPVFDRILVDAPCSGTGTLDRNPEIRWRLTPEEIPRYAERQKRILCNALAALKPGGILVYSTCSLEMEENEEVVNASAAGRVQSTVLRLPGRDPGDGFFAAVIT